MSNENKTDNDEKLFGTPFSREDLGRMIREAWVEWAKEQPNAQPSWTKPWEELGEGMKEVDRRMGERVAREIAFALTADLDATADSCGTEGGQSIHYDALGFIDRSGYRG